MPSRLCPAATTNENKPLPAGSTLNLVHGGGEAEHQRQLPPAPMLEARLTKYSLGHVMVTVSDEDGFAPGLRAASEDDHTVLLVDTVDVRDQAVGDALRHFQVASHDDARIRLQGHQMWGSTPLLDLSQMLRVLNLLAGIIVVHRSETDSPARHPRQGTGVDFVDDHVATGDDDPPAFCRHAQPGLERDCALLQHSLRAINVADANPIQNVSKWRVSSLSAVF